MNWKHAPGVLLLLAVLSAASVVGAQDHSVLTTAAIDSLVQAEWKQQGVVPAAPGTMRGSCGGTISNIAGTIPPAEVVSDFLADRSPDKRARAVEALLDSPRYAENWTNYWNHILMSGRAENARLVDRGAFRQWLYDQFDRNVHWNRFVYDLITATGQNSAGGPAGRAMPIARSVAMVDPDTGAKINGATNWILKYQGKPENISGNASRIFLGVQIQCAPCHDHKTEKWKQTDFRSFTACFVTSRPRQLVADKIGERLSGRTNRRQQIAGETRYQSKDAGGGQECPALSAGATRRAGRHRLHREREPAPGAGSMDDRARQSVVRRGDRQPNVGALSRPRFVEPIDDFRPSNPAVMPVLLKRLAADFVASDYDLKHLVKMICGSQVYQLASTATGKPDQGNTLWARYRLKAMGPDETLDAVIAATNLQPVLEKQFGANVDQMKANAQRQFTFLFDVDEEFEQKEFEGTIPQALMLLNGGLTNRGVGAIPGTALADVMAMPGGDDARVESLYLRTLSRKPTAAELSRWMAFLNAPRDEVIDDRPAQAQVNPRALRQMNRPKQARKAAAGPDAFNRLGEGPRAASGSRTPRQQAYEDLFWALLNSSEFMFNH